MKTIPGILFMVCLADAGSWSSLPSPDSTAEIWGLAAQDSLLAVQTTREIWITGNRGREWRSLGPNKFKNSQRIHLSRGRLFASLPDSKWLHRYSLAHGEWDSVPLPDFDYFGSARASEGYVYSPTGVFAAAGDQAAFGAVVNGRKFLFLSSDEGGRFDSTGTLPEAPQARLGLGMAFGEGGIVFSTIDQGPLSRFSTDQGRTWKYVDGCGAQYGGLSRSVCHMRSGFYQLEWSGRILGLGGTMPCPEAIPDPPVVAGVFGGDSTEIGRRLHPQLAGFGESLFFSVGKSLWVFDAGESAPILIPPSRHLPKRKVSLGLDVLGRPQGMGPGVLILHSHFGPALR